MADTERMDTRDTAAERPAAGGCHGTGAEPGRPAQRFGKWLMLLCVLPALLAVVALLGGAKGLANLGRSGGPLLLLLLCPLMHLVMMRGMGRGDHK